MRIAFSIIEYKNPELVALIRLHAQKHMLTNSEACFDLMKELLERKANPEFAFMGELANARNHL